MLLCSIFLLLLSNSLSFRRDISIYYSRIGIVIQLYCIFFCYNNLFISYLDQGIGLFGGLFNISSISLVFDILIFLVILSVLNSTRFKYKYIMFTLIIACLISFIVFFINIDFIIHNILLLIMLLNVLFVISYYLYNLLKNPIFFKIIKSILKWFGIFLFIFICFNFIGIPEAFAQSPDPDILEELRENLAMLKANYDKQYAELLVKAEQANTQFNILFESVTYDVCRGELIPRGRPFPQAVENAHANTLGTLFGQTRLASQSLISEIDKMSNIDSEIHRITETSYSDSQYQELKNNCLKYKSWN